MERKTALSHLPSPSGAAHGHFGSVKPGFAGKSGHKFRLAALHKPVAHHHRFETGIFTENCLDCDSAQLNGPGYAQVRGPTHDWVGDGVVVLNQLLGKERISLPLGPFI